MTSELRTIYAGEEQKLAVLDRRLQIAHAGLAGLRTGGEPVEHTTRVKDWEITLESSPEGELISAAMARCGSEIYTFERTGAQEWATSSGTLFANAQFYNLVHMATREGLEWRERPVAETITL